MKFIRKNGRIIPIKEKADGNVDKRHVSNKALAEAASRKKMDKSGAVKGAAIGAATGALATLKRSIGTGKFSFSKKTAAITAIAGLALGSVKLTSKQEVANKLKRKAKKK